MNALSGFVNRVDDLGRILLPKEIRRVLKIHTGDSIEISTNNDGQIILKKYEEPTNKEKLVEQFNKLNFDEKAALIKELSDIYAESFIT